MGRVLAILWCESAETRHHKNRDWSGTVTLFYEHYRMVRLDGLLLEISPAWHPVRSETGPR